MARKFSDVAKDMLAEIGIRKDSWVEKRADDLWRQGRDDAWREKAITAPFAGLDFWAAGLQLQRELNVTHFDGDKLHRDEKGRMVRTTRGSIER